MIIVEGVSGVDDTTRVIPPHPNRRLPILDCDAGFQLVSGGQLSD